MIRYKIHDIKYIIINNIFLNTRDILFSGSYFPLAFVAANTVVRVCSLQINPAYKSLSNASKEGRGD